MSQLEKWANSIRLKTFDPIKKFRIFKFLKIVHLTNVILYLHQISKRKWNFVLCKFICNGKIWTIFNMKIKLHPVFSTTSFVPIPIIRNHLVFAFVQFEFEMFLCVCIRHSTFWTLCRAWIHSPFNVKMIANIDIKLDSNFHWIDGS